MLDWKPSDLLDYCPESGSLTWKPRNSRFFANARSCAQWNGRYAGRQAFVQRQGHGCLVGKMLGKSYKAHRVIWAIVYGCWPEGQIDHINGDPSDNRIVNLRCVSHRENALNQKLHSNNTSGVSGVHQQEGRWLAKIRAQTGVIHLGSFDSLNEAAAARKAAEKKHGYHPNHGRFRLGKAS